MGATEQVTADWNRALMWFDTHPTITAGAEDLRTGFAYRYATQFLNGESLSPEHLFADMKAEAAA